MASERGLQAKRRAAFSMALCYPNSYETGMSNLGFLTIFRLANEFPHMRCERAFYSQGDLSTLETGTALGRFDVAGFSLSYELDYPRAIRMIGDSGIALLSRDRSESAPVVVAGGPAVTMNPLPLAPFFDALFIGDAEESFAEFAGLLKEQGRRRKSGWRSELLKALCGVEGVFVPAFPERVRRRYVDRLDSFLTYSPVVTPNAHFKSMYLVLVERGCPRGCRFCCATYSHRPFRVKSADSIIEQIPENGPSFSRIGLVGAGLSDHPDIEKLCVELARQGKEVSVSSLRADNITPGLLGALVGSGLRTLTMAPEAGSTRMREVVGKPLARARMLDNARMCRDIGVKALRLYFMVGLPFELESDAEAIVELADDMSREFGRAISLRLSPFVPKANTPFQGEPLASEAVMRRRIELVRKGFSSNRNVNVAARKPKEAVMEAVFSTGGAEVGAALRYWYEWKSWKRAFRSAGVDPLELVHSPASRKEEMPWDIVDFGCPKALLEDELSKARRAASELPPG